MSSISLAALFVCTIVGFGAIVLAVSQDYWREYGPFLN